MEWREQSSLTCTEAFREAQRWMEEVTKKSFGSDNFRAALENGVLLCDLINQLKPGIIKRVNRLSTPIAGLDNVSVFLKACAKLSLNESQLFHPGDLQDLSSRVTLRREESNRRLKNVLITIYWLGRKAQLDTSYSGPQLNFKAFEGLLGLALSKALEEGSGLCVRHSIESWSPEREDTKDVRPEYGRVDSVDSVNSLDRRGLQPGGEGDWSDVEVVQCFTMVDQQPPARRGKGPRLPPPLLRRKRGLEENGRGCPSPLSRVCQIQVRPGRPPQVNPGWIWSKSTSDMPRASLGCKASTGDNFEGKDDRAAGQKGERPQGSLSKAKESEEKWQDDLTKWKNRRRSTNSDLCRKLQDREHVMTQMTNAATSGRGPRDVRDGSAGSSSSRSSCSGLRPRTRALLARGYTAEAPHPPVLQAQTQVLSTGAMPASNTDILEEQIYSASLASDGVPVSTPTPDHQFSSQTQLRAQACLAPLPASSKSTSGLGPTTDLLLHRISPPAGTTTHVDPKVSTLHHGQFSQGTVDSSQNQKPPQEVQQRPWEEAADQGKGSHSKGTYRYSSRTMSWSGSASLPRGYRRSEGSARLSSVVTARPFGTTKPSRVSSLPRLHNASLNGLVSDEEASPPGRGKLTRQVATSQVRVPFLRGNVEDGIPSEERAVSRTDGLPFPQSLLLPKPLPSLQSHQTAPPKPDLPQVHHSEMRVSLSVKPNSVEDFGFQAEWDSTGARVKLVELGSPAELCQLCAGDEIVAVGGTKVSHLSYGEWENAMAAALQTGRLVMDISRYCNEDWGTSGANHPAAKPCQSRKNLNLTSAAPTLIGRPGHLATSTQSTEGTAAVAAPFDGLGVNGELTESHKTARSKGEYERIVRKNQKRRTAFFNQKGGSESAISDLQVPSLKPSPSSWCWDYEEERRRQERWQEEQERLLQEQYQRDQERLEAEWRRAQQDAMGHEYRKSEQTVCQSDAAPSPQIARAAPNRAVTQTRGGEQSLDRQEGQEAAAKPHGDDKGEKSERLIQDAAAASLGFARLSFADRAKSKSTPTMAGLHKQARGDEWRRTGQTVSKAEQERQQILEEMKKRTQLLTDNSWIRQRSRILYKEPVYTGVPLRRYESLDNLHVSWCDTQSQSATHCVPAAFSRSQSVVGYRSFSPRYSVAPEAVPWSKELSCFFRDKEAAGDLLSASRQCSSFLQGPRQESGSEFNTGCRTASVPAPGSSLPPTPSCEQSSLHQIVE